MDGYVLSVERTIEASPEAIFALLADASRHQEIDGSGTLRGNKAGGPEPLSLGSVFGMSMKLGVAYSMRNTVVEFEPGRRIAWQAEPGGFLGRISGGRIWRYDLELAEGGTLVRESWDLTQDHQRAFLRLGPTPKSTARNMEKTLERIAQLTEGQGPAGS